MTNSEILTIFSILSSIITAYLTTKAVLRNELNIGKNILFELSKKYFIAIFNVWDFKSNCLKNDPSNLVKYSRQLVYIESVLQNLSSSPYYIKLLLHFPDLTMLEYRINSEIVEIDKSKINFCLDAGTAQMMYKIYTKTRGEQKKSILKNKSLVELDGLIKAYMETNN